MNARYCVSRADKGREDRPMFPSDELLRAVMNDRERQVQERIRVRRMTGSRQPVVRWRSGQIVLGRQVAKHQP
jgi:hypothetical protein